MGWACEEARCHACTHVQLGLDGAGALTVFASGCSVPARVLLEELMRRREELNSAGANFMQKLRESEFLNAIKHRSAIPGGTC